MNLGGWDMVSAVGIGRINAALAAKADTATEFDFHEDTIRLSGTFGPWQIVQGGSVRLLHVTIPLTAGKYSDSLRRHHSIDLAGMALVAELALRLIPSTVEPGAEDLVFDLDRGDATDGAQPPVRILRLDGAEGRLDGESAKVVALALGAALSAHPDHVGHVFARARKTGADTGSLAMPYHDWAWMETAGGEGHMALLGALSAPTAAMAPDPIDPRIMGAGVAAFALSDCAFFSRVLAPWLNTHFHPRGSFVGSASGVTLKGNVQLPAAKSSGYTLRPLIETMRFTRKGAALQVDLHTRTRIDGHSVQIMTDMRMTLPLAFDAKSGSVALKPDPAPQCRSWAEGTGFWGGLEAFIANLVLIFAQDQIVALVRSIAHATQKMAAPTSTTVMWPGQPDFQASSAELVDCFFFADKG